MANKSALQRVQEAESNHAAAQGQVQQAQEMATKWSGIAEMARSELLQEKDETIREKDDQIGQLTMELQVERDAKAALEDQIASFERRQQFETEHAALPASAQNDHEEAKDAANMLELVSPQ